MDLAYCDALRFALEYEQQGEKAYRSAAARAKDAFAEKALIFLADEEVEHIRKIELFNRHLLGEGDFDLSLECSVTLPERVSDFINQAHRQDERAEATISDLEVYDLAMKTEKQGYELYESVLPGTNDERLKTFFRFLANEERVHYRLLAESKKYLEDSSYYFEEAGGWIFG